MKSTKVICHAAVTVDGKIKPHNWPMKNLGQVFEKTAEQIKFDAWVVGRTTMEGFSNRKTRRLGPADRSIKKTDFVGEHKTRTFAVVIDPSGKCRWESNMVTTEHVIEVLTERVSTAYLRHLRDTQVSYIFAGKTEINLKLAVRKLARLFRIHNIRVDGGGKVWGSFLKAGLVDEVSHLVLPIADGSYGTPTFFDAEEGHTRRPAVALTLRSVERLSGGVIWLRYKVKR